MKIMTLALGLGALILGNAAIAAVPTGPVVVGKHVPFLLLADDSAAAQGQQAAPTDPQAQQAQNPNQQQNQAQAQAPQNGSDQTNAATPSTTADQTPDQGTAAGAGSDTQNPDQQQPQQGDDSDYN